LYVLLLRKINRRVLFFWCLWFFIFLVFNLWLMSALCLWLFVIYGEIFEKNTGCHCIHLLLFNECSLLLLALLTHKSFYFPSAGVVLSVCTAMTPACLMWVALDSSCEGRWSHVLALTHIILHVLGGTLGGELWVHEISCESALQGSFRQGINLINPLFVAHSTNVILEGKLGIVNGHNG
jgi:hypothetical protein